jgi:uncharacterized protein (TIGR04222 family)
MLDLLIRVPGPDFLLYFAQLAALAILLGWIWIRRDGTGSLPVPGPTRLDARALAALRGGRQGLLHLARLRLWEAGLIKARGGADGKDQLVANACQPLPTDPIETLVYRFSAARERAPGDYFKDKSLHRRQLRTGAVRLLAARRVRTWVVLGVLALGGAKLVLGILHAKPIGFLVLLLALSLILALVLLRPPLTTALGRAFLASMRQRLAWMKTNSRPNSDPGLAVALFGLAAVAGVAGLIGFHQAFAGTERNAGDSSGGCGGGGCGGSDSGGGDGGGGGGGCGGCGGGGD